MRYQELLEYINYDKEKFLTRWKAEGSPYADSLSDSDFASWLEDYDPTSANKYVNWMITRYLKNDIKRLEDIPSRIAPALDTFMRLGRKKKLKPEHKDINRITNIEDVIDEYKSDELDLSSKSEVVDNFYKSGDAELVFNDSQYKVVIPKTEEASKYFGKNTRWCTAAENNNMFDMYVYDGPLYIILEKATNKRWQFHFLSGQYMDEQDRSINLIGFFINKPALLNLFTKLKYVKKLKDGGYVIRGENIIYYNKAGQKSRSDGPAVEYSDGRKYWYLNGKQHREDGPAVIYPDGHKGWWHHGQLHRLDGPAIITGSGSKYWYLNGEKHREDGPAIEYARGGEEWYQNGKKHRIGGPAINRTSGDKQWWVDGKQHREDGPAVEYNNGYKLWWLNGKEYSEDDFNKKVKQLSH